MSIETRGMDRELFENKLFTNVATTKDGQEIELTVTYNGKSIDEESLTEVINDVAGKYNYEELMGPNQIMRELTEEVSKRFSQHEKDMGTEETTLIKRIDIED